VAAIEVLLSVLLDGLDVVAQRELGRRAAVAVELGSPLEEDSTPAFSLLTLSPWPLPLTQ
jgi:hypothetical protein